MPFISADQFTNPILKKIASGDESVFLDMEPHTFDVEENARYRTWRPLSLASNNGHISVVALSQSLK